MKESLTFTVRRAEPGDVDDIAAAHLDSIRSIGAHYYSAETVNDWGARVKGALYLDAMAQGEIFFIAVGESDVGPRVLGFSSHRVKGNEHHTAVYVRGRAARLGVGSSLFRTAEASAVAAGAASFTSIRL